MKPQHSNTTLLGSLNSFSQGRSGGDMVFAKVMAELEKTHDSAITTSKLGDEFCREIGVKSSSFIVTTKEESFKSPSFTYIKRILLSLYSVIFRIKISKNAILLAGSDFLTETIPLAILKMFSRNRLWVQHIFHVIPSERKVSHYSQMLSFWLIRHLSNSVIVDNNLLKTDLVDNYGFKKELVKVNYPGIYYNRLLDLPKIDVKYDAVCFGRLAESKGITDLVYIWSEICKKAPQSKLAIIGKGDESYTTKIIDKIGTYNLEKNIDMLGFLPEEEAYQTIKESKLFVSTSYEEGFGISFLEGQALGLPILAWDLPVFKEVFASGMIKHKKKDFESYIKSYFELATNEEKYKMLQKDAVKNASKFSWKKTIETEEKIIFELQSS